MITDSAVLSYGGHFPLILSFSLSSGRGEN